MKISQGGWLSPVGWHNLKLNQAKTNQTKLNQTKRHYLREDDSIPLADGDPADFVEDSLVSEDKRKVGEICISNDARRNSDQWCISQWWCMKKQGLTCVRGQTQGGWKLYFKWCTKELWSMMHLTMIMYEKIPSEMEVAPPHKRFSHFSALIKL